MTIWRYYSSTAVADTCNAALTTGSTSIVAGSGAPVGYPTSYPFTLSLDQGTSNEELVSVTAGLGTSGSPWTVTRAYDGTTAKTHSSGATITHASSGNDFATAASHYNSGSGSGVHGLPASAWATASFAKIQDQLLSTSTSTVVSFTGIPNTYLHLLLFVQGRLTDTGNQSNDLLLTFNGDSSAVYGYVSTYSYNPSGTMSTGVGNGFAATSFPAMRLTASQAGAAVNAGGGVLFIPNYAATSYNKLIYSLTGGGNGTTAFVDIRSRIGIYNPTTQAAVTSFSLAAAAGDYLVGSRFTLYGLS